MQLRHLVVDNLYVRIACLGSLYNAATTKLDIDAFEAMKPYLLDEYGNASQPYIPFPLFLMDDSLADLSNDAKVLYALMLDRASISKINGFIEADGTIRLYFTVEQAQKKLHRSRQCVTRIFRELEYSGLICRKKQGLGKPALITLNYPSNAKLIRPKEAGENLSG